ncbi:MAG: ArsR/SmtB family transcription factor [Lysobacterales bacterium]
MITDSDQDLIFQALAHSTRREILDRLKDQPGQPVGTLASHFDVSRIAVMNHLAVLEKAGLVTSEKEARSRRLYLNVIPLQLIYDRWTDTYSSHWAGKLTTIKYAAERAAQREEKK